MTCDMRLELYAIAVGLDSESGSAIITHQLEIVTETDIISVPFAANILVGRSSSSFLSVFD